MATFSFYSDAALTTDARRQVFAQASTDPVAADRVVYFGSRTAGVTAYGVSGDDLVGVTVNVTDEGGDSAASDVRLATTQAGLDTAEAGAGLDIGAVVSGVANAVPVWIRVLDSSGLVGAHDNLSLTAEITEVAE